MIQDISTEDVQFLFDEELLVEASVSEEGVLGISIEHIESEASRFLPMSRVYYLLNETSDSPEELIKLIVMSNAEIVSDILNRNNELIERRGG